ncbi:uncharacterized protein EDB91DRAFT_512302 [Suillus paluster]|uniref:uncharacterized protein n=1 Tax=Suillus paluster TaxID=48578 RepID=UPI001B886A5D|nr:uncharacterized protein EDB91DRAFT_512302 [Suillus paluster]KAG1752371.1 hypothetical protein EDB91DRAFT_512302 [Suillus paluster]
MSRNHEFGLLTNHLRVFLKALPRYLACPLRLLYRLFHILLQLYSRSIRSRRQFLRAQTDGRQKRVAGSIQPPIPLLPLCNNQLQVPIQPSAFASNSSVLLSPVHTPPTSVNHALQLHSVGPVPSQGQSEFRPFAPSQVMRYGKKPTIKRDGTTDEFLKAGTINFSDPGDSVEWDACVHPEGALYYHDAARGTYTESNMRDEQRRRQMNLWVDELLRMYSASGIQPGTDIELVVESTRRKGGEGMVCRYYFVYHPERLLFWLHPMPTDKLFDGVAGVTKPSHIKHAIENQYWQQCELYPNAKNLEGPLLLKELKEIVVHASAETITTDLSLSPFDGDELSKILELISQLQDYKQDEYHARSICVIARFMRYFKRARFFNFGGLTEARLNADQFVYVKKKRGKLIVVLSWAINVALFGAPRSHMNEIRRVWVDRSLNSPRWKKFNNKLSNEWSGITMYSTVMMAVDVSFLAVPSVSLQNSGSVTVISTYISLFCIVGSLVVSLFLTRQNQTYGQESADKAVKFLERMTGSAFGTKAVATIHGLPYAMLLMMYFMLGFSYQVFTSTPIITLATTGSACAIMALFTLWLVSAARDFHMLTWLLARLEALKEKICSLHK